MGEWASRVEWQAGGYVGKQVGGGKARKQAEMQIICRLSTH